MGFDLFINLNVGIDPKTGMAFVYALNTNVGVKPFVPSEYTVPEKYRTYLKQRGSHFHQYIKKYRLVPKLSTPLGGTTSYSQRCESTVNLRTPFQRGCS
jgi:hypothetical protein